MARLVSKKSGKSIEIKDGQYIRKAAEELGVAFGCNTGVCGLCAIKIIEGEKNLSKLTQEEKNLNKNSKNRLACQCKINKGEAIIDF